jgi:type II secretory pathway pseudopilin PulG
MQKCHVLVVWLSLLASAAALGGNNIFGVFRKRRRAVQKLQDKRCTKAAAEGFAGPHGEPLTAQEAQELLVQHHAEPTVWQQIVTIFDLDSSKDTLSSE